MPVEMKTIEHVKSLFAHTHVGYCAYRIDTNRDQLTAITGQNWSEFKGKLRMSHGALDFSDDGMSIEVTLNLCYEDDFSKPRTVRRPMLQYATVNNRVVEI